MLTPLNTIFVRETVKEKHWERWRDEESERRRDRQKDRQKDLVFSGFQLVCCNSPIGRRVAFSVPPSRTSKKQPDIQTTVHTVETFGRVRHRQTCQYECILARCSACLIPKVQCLSVLIFTWVFMQCMPSTVEKKKHSQHCSCQESQLSETLLQT